MSVQQQLEYWSNLSCQRQMVSWVSRALSLSPDIFVIYIPLPSHSLLSSFFFFFFSKSLQPRVLLWHSKPHPEPEAIQELLLHLAVDAEGTWCCGSYPQVSSGSQAGKGCSPGACFWGEDLGSSSISVSQMIKSCSWSCAFPAESATWAEYTAQCSLS